ncbi:glycosyltransferase family 2 protein [Rhodococcus sp. AG1013]|uniref:glycosyltransferase family 2 protein n=1 Tax=unclassified Rhodococcus (in: high G+C Gram-positive bacteria) TaxID=192944 RepID=UPI000E2C45AE|nr:glycosyltransferase family 2 protein [Rhodococcus sp. AG1013]RDI28192.1 cellulose synthase/poly-beta-1,6-N-acetylglucosamine synthase-like glycosyltransferase [Rhodococcus sp. AG1013]
MTFDTVLGLTIVLSLILGLVFLVYVIAILVPFLRHVPERPGDPDEFELHFIIPCLNEEVVIGDTLSYLRRHFPDCHAWVTDDESEDGTRDVVAAIEQFDPMVHLLPRTLPNARTGKGDALNFGYRAIDAQLPDDVDRNKVLICIVDADGRPAPNMLEISAGPDCFGNDYVGSVQVEVRMSNRADPQPLGPGRQWKNRFARTLVRLQDLEFRGPISAMQMARRYSRTVSIGGNGQLSRLSALDAVAARFGEPWHGALLEDFELGLHLILLGWRNAYTTASWVDQEALPELKPLIRQRVRWAQGGMQCIRYLPAIWRSRRVTNLGAWEITYFMLTPWLQVIGTIVYPLPLLVMTWNMVNYPEFFKSYLVSGGWALFVSYLILGVGEFAIWGPLYRRRSEPQLSRLHGIVLGVSYVGYMLMSYVVAWRAFGRLISRQSDWVKTKRNAERTSVPMHRIAGT